MSKYHTASPPHFPLHACTLQPVCVQLVRVQGNASAGEFVRNLQFSNLEVRGSEADVSDCFSTSCDAQSADFLTSATIHISGGVGGG